MFYYQFQFHNLKATYEFSTCKASTHEHGWYLQNHKQQGERAAILNWVKQRLAYPYFKEEITTR